MPDTRKFDSPSIRDGFRGHVIAGLALAAVLVGGIGGWAHTARISGAVIATGMVGVDQNLKEVQHRDGGLVAAILVRAGEAVSEGQTLIRLEDSQSRAELAILSTQLIEAQARRARLIADRDGMTAIAAPAELVAAGADAESILAGERRLHAGNLAFRAAEREQIDLIIRQTGEEIVGLEAQRVALAEERALVETNRLRLAELAGRKLVEAARMDEIDRDLVRIRGRIAETDAAIARAHLRVSEFRSRRLAQDRAVRAEAQRDLVPVESRIAELTERIGALRDRIARTDIRAPIAGHVNELHVFTEGGVITPAQVLATIVPADARLRVEVRIDPASIDQVRVGQEARVRFSAFSQRTTPELRGTVSHVSPATARDPRTGESFYVAFLQVTEEERARLGGLELLPGMPVEVHLTTEEQRVLAYLAKPITDQFSRAFREE
ncbi:MAG: HlyD family type I secretion periplasmic adaptor subunit [Albidovulum sp.]